MPRVPIVIGMKKQTIPVKIVKNDQIINLIYS